MDFPFNHDQFVSHKKSENNRNQSRNCLYCEQIFESKTLLRRHCLLHHPYENSFRKSQSCTECGYYSNNFQEYHGHIESTGHMKRLDYKDYIAMKMSNVTSHEGLQQQMPQPQSNYRQRNGPSSTSMYTYASNNHGDQPLKVYNSNFGLPWDNSNRYNPSNTNQGNYQGNQSFFNHNTSRPQNSFSVNNVTMQNHHPPPSSYPDVRARTQPVPPFSLYFNGTVSLDIPSGETQSWVLQDNSTNMIVMQERVKLSLGSLFSICAEYSALIAGLRYCLSQQINMITICCSTEMMYLQLQGNQMRHLASVSYASRHLMTNAYELLKMFQYYNLRYIQIEDNLAKQI